VSILPERWLNGPERLKAFLASLSPEIGFQTAVGRGKGRLARDVLVRFSEAPTQSFRFDFLVSANLNDRNYGLISLRDVVRHFHILMEGAYRLGTNDEPIDLPDLVLIPHGNWPAIRYRCPGCSVETWGRPGLNLACNDCGRTLVP
jgi:hypothetical protein